METGQLIGKRYELQEELGRGGMGVVYAALDEKFQTRVALKIAHPPAPRYHTFKVRFKREAKISHKLGKMDGLVRALDWGEIKEESALYMAMDLIPQAKPLDLHHGSLVERLDRLERAAELVAKLHGLGVIHRDVKPENFMVDAQGGIHLGDFGLAKMLDGSVDDKSLIEETATKQGVAMGTPLFMPPEQFEDAKAVDERVDVFALGVMLFCSLTERFPYVDDDSANLVEIVSELMEVRAGNKPRPSVCRLRPEVDPTLDELCAQAIEVDREKRIGDARTFLQRLRVARGKQPLPDPDTVIPSSTANLATLDEIPIVRGPAGPPASAPKIRPPSPRSTPSYPGIQNYEPPPHSPGYRPPTPRPTPSYPGPHNYEPPPAGGYGPPGYAPPGPGPGYPDPGPGYPNAGYPPQPNYVGPAYGHAPVGPHLPGIAPISFAERNKIAIVVAALCGLLLLFMMVMGRHHIAHTLRSGDFTERQIRKLDTLRYDEVVKSEKKLPARNGKVLIVRQSMTRGERGAVKFPSEEADPPTVDVYWATLPDDLRATSLAEADTVILIKPLGHSHRMIVLDRKRKLEYEALQVGKYWPTVEVDGESMHIHDFVRRMPRTP